MFASAACLGSALANTPPKTALQAKAVKSAQTTGAAEFKTALQRLKDGDFDAALFWFDTAKRKTSDGKMKFTACAHRALIFAAKELGFLVLTKLYMAGGRLAIVSSGDSTESAGFDIVREGLKRKGRRAAEELLAETGDLLRSDKGFEVNIEIDVPLKGLSIDYLKDEVSRGEMPDQTEREKLEHGIILRNYINLVTDVLGIPAESMLTPPYKGRLLKNKLYLVLGSRLRIIAETACPSGGWGACVDYENTALKCFDKVIELSPRDRYDRDRARAEEEKQKILSVKKERKAVTCPKCGRIMRPDWKYCPYDGTKLNRTKGDAKR